MWPYEQEKDRHQETYQGQERVKGKKRELIQRLDDDQLVVTGRMSQRLRQALCDEETMAQLQRGSPLKLQAQGKLGKEVRIAERKLT